MSATCDDCGERTEHPVPVPAVSRDWTCCSRCAGKRAAQRTVPDWPVCVHGSNVASAYGACAVLATERTS